MIRLAAALLLLPLAAMPVRAEGYDDLSADCLWRWIAFTRAAEQGCSMPIPGGPAERLATAQKMLADTVDAQGMEGHTKIVDGERTIALLFDPSWGPSPVCVDYTATDRMRGLITLAERPDFMTAITAMTRRSRPLDGECP